MSTDVFVHHLASLGVVLTASGGRLRCAAPRRVLTPEIREEIARRKPEILALLGRAQAEGDALVITPVPRDGPLPLARAQERIWFLHQLAPEGSAYNITPAMRLKGRLDRRAFEHAWSVIVGRHEALRTTFPMVGGVPVQQVHAPSEVPVRDLDLREVAAAEREAAAIRLAVAEADRPFDLENGPLLRVTLLRLAEDDALLVLAVHHIVADQWSVGILAQEFAELYEASVANREPRLRDLPIQYADYAYWHRRWLEGETLQQQLGYWKRQLAGLRPQRLAGSAIRQAPAQGGARGSVAIPPRLLRALRARANAERVTLFMMLVAAFKIVLRRYTGEDDLAVGTPIANRTHVAVEGLVGQFVNTLVFRTDASGNPTFRELLGRVKEAALQAFAHQDIPFDYLVSELAIDRDPDRPPLFQVLFNVQNSPLEVRTLAGLDVTPVLLPRTSSQFDLTVSIDPELEGRIAYAYNPAVFDGAAIERLFAHFLAVLDEVAADPARRIDAIEMLGAAERTRILHEWNRTGKAVDPATLPDLLERQARVTPDALAVIHGTTRVTYGELNERANRLAHYLRSAGAGPDVLVSVCLDRSIDLLVALLAILKAGAAYLPLDPAFPSERLAFMLEDSAAPLVVTERRLAAFAGWRARRTIYLDTEQPAIEACPSRDPARTGGGDTLAYVLYTSGSTGRPKGVQISHAALANFLAGVRDAPGISAADRLLAVTTLSFDIAVLELYLPLVAGATVVLAARDETIDPAALERLIAEHRITMLQATPATWRLLLEHGWAGNPQLTVLCGGEAMSRELADRLLPRARAVWNLYGPTETTVWSTIERVRAGTDGVSIGRPLQNTRVYVLDSRLQPVPVGVAGELFIGGRGVARGYLNQPELTATRFLPDPFSEQPGARMYRTGDLARFRPDGRLDYAGRCDSQVKLRGYRIELGEIEATLESHPAVRQAVASLDASGRGEPRLIAHAVPREGAPVPVDDLRAYLAARLPAYMVPSVIVSLDALPLTPNGKVDRRALPPPAGPPAPACAELPRTPIEDMVAGIWADVLERPGVGIHQDFFELGGHSLLAARLVRQLGEIFAIDLPLRTLFESPTVAETALAIVERLEAKRASQPERRADVLALNTAGHRPPFFFLHAALQGDGFYCYNLARYLGEDQPMYALAPLGLDGRAVPASIESMARRYIEDIQRVQPHGPYYIGGFCASGVVAFEIARQLRAAGETVRLLALVEAAVGTSDGLSRLARRTTRALRFGARLSEAQAVMVAAVLRWYFHRAAAIWQGGPREIARFVRRQGRFRAHRLVRRWQRARRPAPPPAADERPRLTEEESGRQAIADAYSLAQYAYVADPYDGPAVCMWAEEEPYDPGPWCAAAPGVRLQPVAGNHTTCITTRVGSLAGHLRRALLEAQGEPG